MTGFVEILEVKRVVPDLVKISAGEMLLTHLELDHKNHRARNDHGINAFAHAGDVELQKQRPFQPLQRALEDGDLLKPRIALRRLNRHLAVREQRAENHFRRRV